MKKIGFVILVLPSLVLAQEVQITEIQPFKVGSEEEWFEFTVNSKTPIDIAQWKISNGKTTKTIKTVKEALIMPAGLTLLTTDPFTEESLAFTAPEPLYFSWTKSPVSLANDGATITISDADDQVLSQVTYPKGKSGTRSAYKYSEVFNWESVLQKVYPLIFRNDGNSFFQHTKGRKNNELPSDPATIELLVSEISPDRDSEKGGDFIEIYVKSGPSKINLKYLEIKHNGTPLYYFDSDFWVSPDQFITLYVGKDTTGIVKNTAPYVLYSSAKSGLSSGSGTVELILFSDTSYETTEDFVCYQDEKLSATEAKRVAKNSLNWSSECIEIHDLIANESMARVTTFADTNTKNDFFRHFNGSPGLPNILQNQKPTAVITVQNTGNVQGVAPFSVNLTGENSTDPDGPKDIKTYQWLLENNIFSTAPNPPSFKLNELGTYKVVLTITDFSGASDRVEQIFQVVDKPVRYAGNSRSGGSTKQGKAKVLELLNPKSKKVAPENFFDDFLAQAPASFWKEIEKPPVPRSSFDPPKIETASTPVISRKQQWLHKNIGWAFVEEF